jgi:hypothetical protein
MPPPLSAPASPSKWRPRSNSSPPAHRRRHLSRSYGHLVALRPRRGSHPRRDHRHRRSPELPPGTYTVNVATTISLSVGLGPSTVLNLPVTLALAPAHSDCDPDTLATRSAGLSKSVPPEEEKLLLVH